MRTRAPHSWAVFCAAIVALTACDGGAHDRPTAAPAGTASACGIVAQSILDATQRYLNGLLANNGTNPNTLTSTAYESALRAANDKLTQQGCEPAQTRRSLQAKWGTLKADGPVAAAVLAQLRYRLTETVSSVAVTKTIGVGAALQDALAEIPEGSTLVLQPGKYRLDQSLVVLRGVTIRGADAASTELDSSAADDAVLVMTTSAVTIQNVTVRHIGAAAANVVATGAEASLKLDSVTLRGGRASKKSGGSGLLLASGADEPGAPRTTTLTISGSTIAENAAGGIVVAGRHRASISGTTFSANRECGVCFLGSSDGWVTANTFRDNDVGVSAMADARPILRKNTFSGGQVGIQVSDRAAPTVEGNTITSPQRAALIYTGNSAGTVNGNTCTKDKPGIVIVGTQPYPYLKQNACDVATAR